MSRRHLNATGDFARLFDTIVHSSWRWECQGHYEVDADTLDRWRAGLPYEETEAGRQWYAYIRGLRDRGIPFQRVRMLTEPLTEYLRWMLTTTHRNVQAGEDIRWISQSKARDLGMPDYDFYLLDDNRVVIMHFDERKLLTGEELVDDQAAVDHHRGLRDLVWEHAVRHEDYVAAH